MYVKTMGPGFDLFTYFAGRFCHVLELKANRQLEVQLDGGTLMRALKGIPNVDVDLGSIECAIARVDLPGLAKLVQNRA